MGHEFLRHIERCKVIIHMVDAASSEGRDPIDDINKINAELEAYNPELIKRPQVIAANKTDLIFAGDEDPVQKIKDEFEPRVLKYSLFQQLPARDLRNCFMPLEIYLIH